MMTSRSVAFGFALSVAALVFTAPLEAQGLGKRIRDAAVKGAVDKALGGKEKEEAATTTATEGTPASPAARGSSAPSSPAVLEIDTDVLDRFERALAKEMEVRAAYTKAQEDHQACLVEAQLDFTKRVQTAQDRNDEAAVERLMQGYVEFMRGRCGQNPSSGSKSQFEQESSTAGNLTDRQYAILKERVIPFCDAGAPATSERLKLASGYTYSAAEAEALRARCVRLMQTLTQLT